MRHFYKFILLHALIICTGLKSEPIAINNYNINLTVIDWDNIRNKIDFAKIRDNVLKDLSNYLKNIGEPNDQTALGWINNHRRLIIGTSSGVLYAYLISKISTGKAVIYNNFNWSNWKNDIILSDLLAKSHYQISHELNQSIIDKYNNNDQTDLITPLIRFNHDVEQELEILRTFIRIGKNLKRIKLKMFFLLKDRDLELAEEKINRLLYLRNIINSAIHVSLNN